jgi:phosphinothricin acetyltransferase
MQAQDWDRVREIFALGIRSGLATLETEEPSWREWDAAHLPGLRLVACNGEVCGWSALAYAHRTVSAGVAESSVYVHPDWRRRGIGDALLGALVERSEAAGLWTLEARIVDGNAASVALHERHGFRVVGRRERIGRLGGEWRDVLLLERRSTVVGS